MLIFIYLFLLLNIAYAADCKADEVEHTNIDGEIICTKHLATVLQSSQSQCGQQGEFNIWVNTALAASEIYTMASDSWSVGQLTVSNNLNIPTSSIKTEAINNNAITNAKMSTNSVANAQLVSGSVTADKIASNAVGSSQLMSNSVTSAKIAANSITSSELAGNSVLSGSILDGTITSADIANDAVTSDKLADSISVTNLDVTGKLEAKSDAEIKGYLRLTAPKWWSSNVNAGALFSSSASSLGPGVFKTTDDYHKFSIFADGIIYSTTYVAASDERIKENIQPLADFEALHIIRKLDAKSYEYKDKYERGWNRTLGFIAQDVQKHIPEAVKVISKEIPSIYDGVEVRFFKQGDDKYEMKLLNRVLEPGKYAFYVSDTDDNKMTTVKSVDMTTEDGITFISNDKHDEVFLRGPYVDDFLTIDKNKIFAVAYAALQQVDKNQQILQKKVKTLEATIKSLTKRLDALESK